MTEKNRTADLKSEVERPPLRWLQLRALIDQYAAGRLSLGRYDRAAAALLRKPKEVPMIPIARAFAILMIVLAIGCGGPPVPEPSEPARVAPPAAKPGCRWLATVDGPRCLPDGRDIFWESDSQPRVTVLPTSVSVDTPDSGIRWIFFLTGSEPATIRQIVLVPQDAFRVDVTRFVIPHPIGDVTIPLDWFSSFFQ